MIIQQRYVVACMGFLACAICMHCRLALSNTLPEMVYRKYGNFSKTTVDGSANHSLQHGSEKYPRLDWSEESQGLMLSSLYIGYILIIIPGGIIADKFGGKHVVGVAIFINGLSTALNPFAALAGENWMIVIRLITGLGQGLTFPGIGVILAKWVPRDERAVIGCIVYLGLAIGIVNANLLAGVIMWLYEGNWALVFYANGGIALVGLILWYMLVSSEPSSHPFISDEERSMLEEKVLSGKNVPPPPWRSILTSLPVFANVVAMSGFLWSFYLLTADLPKYISGTMYVNPIINGVLGAAPFIVMSLGSVVSAVVCDKLTQEKIMGLTGVRKLFSSITLGGCAFGLIGATFAGSNSTAVIVLLCIGIGSLGSSTSATRINVQDLSPNYCGLLLGLANGTGAACAMLTPYLIGILAPNQTVEEYNNVFYITGTINIATMLIFLCWGSGEVQKWNNIDNFSESPNQQDGTNVFTIETLRSKYGDTRPMSGKL